MKKSESIKELSAALAKVQANMKKAKKDKENPYFKSKYSDLTQILDVCYEILPENGLSFSQLPISNEKCAGVETILMHISGEWISNTLLLPSPKQDPQAYGSCITYAKRYSLCAIFGIPTEDDDAESAMDRSRNKNTPSQATPVEKTCKCGAIIKNGYSQCYSCYKLHVLPSAPEF